MDSSLIPSSEYNALPYIRQAHDRSQLPGHNEARAKLLQLIAEHDLSAIFSVHLLHKHSDAPEGKVMVYELVEGPDHPTFRVLVPRNAQDFNKTHTTNDNNNKPPPTSTLPLPKYFHATPTGVMRAYEYTHEPLPILPPHAHSFLPLFAQTLHSLSVSHTFCLGIIPLVSLPGPVSEIELPEFNATVFVKDVEMLPDYREAITEWMNNTWVMNREGVLVNESKNVQGRCVYHKLGHGAAGFEAVDGREGEGRRLCVNGVPLEEGTEVYGVIANALEYVAVA